MDSRHLTPHVKEVLETFTHTMETAQTPAVLVSATGLLLGVRTRLVTLADWQEWGQCVAVLVRTRYEADAAAATRRRAGIVGRRWRRRDEPSRCPA